MDSKEEIYCPLCGKKMKKFIFENTNINIDICLDGCGGIFFDGRELKKVSDNEIDSNKLVELISNKEFEKIDITKQIKCPTCGAYMVQHYTTPSKRNAINECYSCGSSFVMYDVFIKMLEEAKLPPEKRENMMDYLSTYMTPEITAELNKDKINAGSLRNLLYGIIK